MFEDTYVRVVEQRYHHPVHGDEAYHDVNLGPPRDDKRTSDICYLVPVKVEDTHTQTRDDAEKLVDDNII